MDNSEKQLLRDAAAANPTIRRAYERHLMLDRKVSELVNKRFLTDNEQVEISRLKKEKLAGKERLHKLLSEFRSRGSARPAAVH